MSEARLEDLEVRMAFQDKLIGELDDVVRLLRDEIDRLKAEVGTLRAQVQASSAGASSLADEKPPHY